MKKIYLLIFICSCFLLGGKILTAGAQTTSSLAEIVSTTGDVSVFHQNSWQQANTGQFLYRGDKLRTGEDGLAAILADDGSRIHINRNSLFILKEVASSAGWISAKLQKVQRSVYQLFSWKKGKASAISLENNNPQVEIDLETQTVKAGIRGTSLVVRVEPQPLHARTSVPSSIVMVTDGLVDVQALTGTKETLRVTSGYQVTARPGRPLQLTRMTIRPLDAVQWTLNLPSLKAFEPSWTTHLTSQLTSSIHRAYEAVTTGQFSMAIELLEKLVKKHSQEAVPSSLLALTFLATNQKDAAHTAAQDAVEKDPESSTAAIVLSYTFQALFKLSEAKEWTLKALELEPNNKLAKINLARLLFGEGNIMEAWEMIDSPGKDFAKDAEVENLKGFIRIAQRNTEEAGHHFSQAIALNPRFAEPHLGLALVQMRRGQTEEAFKEMAKAVLLEPQRSLLYSYWGKMLAQVGRFPKAFNAFSRAHTLDPQDPTPEFHKALLLQDLYKPAEAIRSLNSAIALNDNRAVYRSRFLLDQDLATKSINLSTLYKQLGMSAWARNKALASIKYDYTNFSGHLFYAGSLSEEEDRSYSFASEALLARLLQPANINTFNNFNNYSIFFEQPKVQGTIIGQAGNNSTYGAGGEVYGALPSANLAFNLGGAYEDTDGWRENSFERLRSGVAIAKWQPTLKDGFLAVVSKTNTEQGNAIYPRFEYDSPSRPDDRFEGEVQRYELGYHRNFGPGSDLLLYGTYLGNDLDIFQKERLDIALDDFTVDAEQSIHAERPFWQGQLQYTIKVDNHQLLLGTLQYHGQSLARSSLDLFLRSESEDIFLPFSSTDNDIDISFASYYLHDTWQVNPTLTFEIDAYYDRMDNANAFSGTSWTIDNFNPRFGIIFAPTQKDTLRLAAFRYLLPFIAPRLDPTNVAGIEVFRNTLEGSQNTEFAFSWDHEWLNGLTTLELFHTDKEFTDKIISEGQEVLRELSGDTRGLEVVHNHLMTDNIGLSAKYRYLDVEDDQDPFQGELNNVNRYEHLFEVGLKYVHRNGFFAGALQTLRYIDNENIRPNDTAAITDLEVGYRFTGRQGEASLKFLNIFDDHFNWVTDRVVLDGRQPVRQFLFSISFNF